MFRRTEATVAARLRDFTAGHAAAVVDPRAPRHVLKITVNTRTRGTIAVATFVLEPV